MATWVAIGLACFASGLLAGLGLAVLLGLAIMGRVESSIASLMGKWHGLQSMRYERQKDGTLVKRVA